MKEVVVMLSLVCFGLLAVQGLPQVVVRFVLSDDNGQPIVDPRVHFFQTDKGITRSELLAYNKLMAIHSLDSTGLCSESQHRLPASQRTSPTFYSQPSSLMSATSYPSERNASPAIF